ncbi:MAG: IS982 family transposase [Acidobacteriota bacterium]|nr:IS982 family transposase [Acidobacteriota bacterium]
MDILTLFFDIDEFCKLFEPIWKKHLLKSESKKRNRKRRLSLSEVMTILILFHRSGYRNLKQFYLEFVCTHLRKEFPALVSYTRFVEFERDALIPLAAYLQTKRGACTGISFADSTKITVCENLRIPQHKQFRDLAKRGFTSTGWFYGFKLHLCVSERGELLSWFITRGNTDDRRPIPKLARKLWGKLFGDKGYVSNPLKLLLNEQGVEFITKLKKNMKPESLSAVDKILLRKRAIIETVFDKLKNISQIEHTRHRSFWNFLVNIIAGLTAYCWREKKPMLNYNVKELGLIV